MTSVIRGDAEKSDLAAKCYYSKTREKSRIRMTPLLKMDLDAKKIRTISMKGQEQVEVLGVED